LFAGPRCIVVELTGDRKREREAPMYAVIQSGGKQYRASEKQVLKLEKLPAEVGQEVTLGEVLLISDGDAVKVGRPFVRGASVTAKVVSHGRGKKIHGFTYKPKKNVHRRFGHRQAYTEVVIEKING